MITKEQIEDLSGYYKIDKFTIMREYLQILFLNYLYQKKDSAAIYFKGGTALRLLFDSARFSEDLDFSTTNSKKEIGAIIKKVENSIQKEISAVQIFPLYEGKKVIRYRLKYQPEDFNYPFVIRLDFSQIKTVKKKTMTSPIVTKFPVIVFPLINHLSKEEILAEKFCALYTRCQGRDFYDVWFLLKKGIDLNVEILKEKLMERGEKFDKKKIMERIKSYSQKQLDRDLSQFLPLFQRKIIDRLKNLIEIEISSVLVPSG